MSVLSRLILSSQRFSSARHGCQKGFVRHFQKKSNPQSVEPSKVRQGENVKVKEPIQPRQPEQEHNLPKFYLYTAVFVPGTFVGCMIWHYENFRRQIDQKNRLKFNHQKQFGARDHFNSYWNQLTPGLKMIVTIISANAAVFTMWRIPACRSFLSRYFLCLPQKRCSVLGATLSGFSHQKAFPILIEFICLMTLHKPLLERLNCEELFAIYLSGVTISNLASCTYRVATQKIAPILGTPGECSVLGATLSGFSHQNAFHIFCNLYVLWSFSKPLTQALNYEQIVAVYLSGITIASLVSCTYRVATRSFIPSLGASGGLLTLIAIVCLFYPDARFSILLVDQVIPHSFTGPTAIKSLVLFDVLGILLRWKLVDHAAHLGGTLFGIFYATYGKSLIWDEYKKPVLKWWHGVRNRPV